MKLARRVGALGGFALAVLPLVSCGAPGNLAVTAPAAVPSSAESASTAATLVAPREATTTPITVTSLVAGTSCPMLQFTISSYVFRVDASTRYTGGSCADVQPGARINFTGTRETETALVFNVATLTFVTSSAPPAPPSVTPVASEGTVTAIGAGRCPELQFFFGAYAINVSYATQYSGGTCADIRSGSRVAFVGTKSATETFIRVTTLTFKDAGSPSPAPTGRPVDGEGVITTLRTGTSCPALAFYIGPYAITLDAATAFDRGSCDDLRAGVRVHVTGSIVDHSVAASRISVQSDSAARPAIEGEGRVTSLVVGSACPSLAFMIEQYTVTVDAATTFAGGTCDDIAAGRRLRVTGTVSGDKQVRASQIAFKADGN